MHARPRDQRGSRDARGHRLADRRAGTLFTEALRARLGPDDYLARFGREQARNREVLLQTRFTLADAASALDGLDMALDAQATALRERVLQHRLVDGHGDLRLEHVCLLRPPVA